MLVKVCGIKYPRNLAEIISLSPDAIGFIFYPPSPRYAGDTIGADDVRNIPSVIIRTGVFVNEQMDNILAVRDKYGLDLIQLHGDETPAFCEKLSAAGVRVMKAFRINDGFDFSGLRDYSSCEYFLFDAAGTNYGGNGVTFDWHLIEEYDGPTPFFLSGGISPGSTDDLLVMHHDFMTGVDVNSGFETAPGVKSAAALDEFINNIRK